MNKYLPIIFPVIAIALFIFLVIRWIRFDESSKIHSKSCEDYKNSSIDFMPVKCLKYWENKNL